MKVLVINSSKYDYLASSIIEGLNAFDFELYFTSTGNNATNVLNLTGLTSIPELFNHLYTSDYIFIFWSKFIDIKQFNTYNKSIEFLLDQTNSWNKAVYIDGSEYNHTGISILKVDQLNPYFFNKAKWYFKRECLPEHISKGVIPLPFSVKAEDSIQSVKSIDVLCAFGQTDTGYRKLAIEACNELKSEGYQIITKPVLEYIKAIQASWITVDAYGGGQCNLRMWQVMSNASCLFAQRYDIVYPELVDGKHYVSWNTKEELKDKIREYLLNKKKLATLIHESYNNILTNHTPKKRIEYILNKIQNT